MLSEYVILYAFQHDFFSLTCKLDIGYHMDKSCHMIHITIYLGLPTGTVLMVLSPKDWTSAAVNIRHRFDEPRVYASTHDVRHGHLRGDDREAEISLWLKSASKLYTSNDNSFKSFNLNTWCCWFLHQKHYRKTNNNHLFLTGAGYLRCSVSPWHLIQETLAQWSAVEKTGSARATVGGVNLVW